MAQRNGAAVGVETRVVIRYPQIAAHRQRLGGKRFVKFDDVHLRKAKTRLSERLARRRCWTKTHNARRQTNGCHSHHPRHRGQAVAVQRRLRGQQQRTGTVVDPRGVAGGDSAVAAERRTQPRQRFDAGLRADMLIVLYHPRLTFALGNGHRDDLLGEAAAVARRRRQRVAARGKAVLRLAIDIKLLGDVFSGLGHRVGAVLLLQQLIDKAPTDGGVVDFGIAAKGAVGLGQHHRRARHRLYPAGNGELHLTRLDRPRGAADSVHPGAAQAV